MRRLRHAPLFWLGFFPLVILLWAWADSVGNSTEWYRAPGADPISNYGATLAGSEISFWASEIDTSEEAEIGVTILFRSTGEWGKVEREPFHVLPSASPEIRAWFPLPRREVETQRYRQGILTGHTFALPLWMIVLCYLPLWLALAWWQARRIARRHAAALPVAQAGARSPGMARGKRQGRHHESTESNE